ncbi:MAG: hypothetical protein P8J27_10600 [Mariniblastus sp.]|nr:hypothetical protein [Mariniblastus sp.]
MSECYCLKWWGWRVPRKAFLEHLANSTAFAEETDVMVVAKLLLSMVSDCRYAIESPIYIPY